MPEFQIDPFWVEVFPWLLIGGWFLYSLLAVTFRSVRNLNYYIFESIPSTFVTLGLLGTFAGIAYGLSTFDTSPDVIKESIQLLLDGLKTAMYTTLLGVSLSIVFSKIIQWILKSKRVALPASPELLELQSLNANFTAFQEAMLHNQRNALKDGLEEVLAQFNETMEDFVNELVTENFKELSKAVDQLTEWQIEHRQDVAGLLVTYRELTTGHGQLVRNTATWVEMMEQIAGQSSNLQKIIDEFDEAFSERGNLSRILGDINKSTLALETVTAKFSSLATNFNETTTSMQVTGDKITGWTDSVAKVSDASGQMVSAVSQMRTIDNAQLTKMFASIDQLFITYMKDVEERLQELSKHAK